MRQSPCEFGERLTHLDTRQSPHSPKKNKSTAMRLTPSSSAPLSLINNRIGFPLAAAWAAGGILVIQILRIYIQRSVLFSLAQVWQHKD